MTKAVAKREAAEVVAPAPASETAAIIQMIERAARDGVDPERMERMYALAERADARRAKAAYLAALAEMQPKLPTIAKHGTIGMNDKDADGKKTGKQVAMTKYAKWEDVVEGIRPIMAEHGFSISFRVAQPTLDRIQITGVLGHRDGHSEETSMSLPIDSSGSKNNVQGWGSSVSYGKRYTAFALLNISARGEDDDGKAAGEEGFITEEQATALRNDLDNLNADIAGFCQYIGVEAIAKIPAAKYARALEVINTKRRKIGHVRRG